ncbi:MAG: ribonuclease Z [Candidatus Bathyarchaeota archaeon]|nr:ribonuclease Z [Candidatus Bathyarchaeota archaeon]
MFLGTGGSMPTRKRNLPCVVIKRGPEVIMLDCGEGTQKQMRYSKIGFNKKMKILISHMHGDHVLGLPGLFQSMSMLGRTKKIDIYGPEGLKDFIESTERTVKYSRRFDLVIYEVNEGKIIEEDEYEIFSKWIDHDFPCLAYALEEKEKPGKFKLNKAKELKIPKGPLWKELQKGKSIKIDNKTIKPNDVLGPSRPGIKLVYASDTRPCKSVIALSKNAEVLIHDCTFEGSHKDKAQEYGHSTASQAAKIAKEACVKKLILIHISAMYEESNNLLKQSIKFHKDTILAEDLMKIEVKK